HLGRCRPACRRATRLSGLAWLHPHAGVFRHQDVGLDQAGRAGDRHTRRIDAVEFLAFAAADGEVAPHPVVAEQSETDEPVGAKADKGAPQPKPVEANLELRSTVGDEAQLRDQTRTADAGRNMRASTGTMSDAPSTANSPAADAGTAKTDDAKPGSGSVDAAKTEAARAATAGKHSGSVDTGNAPSSAPSTDANPADLPVAAEPAGDKPISTDLPADG